MKFLFAIMIIVTGLNIFTAFIIRNCTVIVQYASEKQKVSCEAAVRHNTRIRLRPEEGDALAGWRMRPWMQRDRRV